MCFLTPRTRGVKITIFTIVSKRNAQLFCPFRSSIIYVFGSSLHFSCDAVFIYLTLRDMNIFRPLSCSHLWYVHFYYLKAFLTRLMCHLLLIKLPDILQTLLDAALRPFLCGRSGLPLMFSHCFILIQAKLELQKWTICCAFHLVWPVQGMYFLLYSYFY